MKPWKRLFFGIVGAALIAALASPLVAQVNRVAGTFLYNSAGALVVSQTGAVPTYSAAYIGLVPASSATDTVCLAGSATKTVEIRRWFMSGTAGTLVTVPIHLDVHTVADTGGTAASTTANPATNVRAMDSSDSAATATAVSYTAVPTIDGSQVFIVRSGLLTLPTTGAGTADNVIDWHFGVDGGKTLVLRGAAQQACAHLSSVSVSSGVLNGFIEWTEN